MSHHLEHWQKVRVSDIAAPKKYALNGGPFGSKLVTRDYIPEGVPVIRGSNLTGGTSFSFDDFVYVSEEKADELLPNNAHPGDLIFTQRGTLGQVGLIPKECEYERFVVSQSQMKLTVDETKADPYFVYIYFRSPTAIQAIQNLTITSGVPHINLKTLRDFEMPLPPLDVQKVIVGILSAYDDLIANNNRRMALLEESMHLLYREWFVRLRFPGHERVKVVDGVPEGWEKTTVENAFQILGGGTPSRKEERFWTDGSINWYAPSDLTKTKLMFMESSSDKINETGLSNSSARLFQPYSVMMTSRATIGAVAINTTEACTNQGFITCLPNEHIPLYFLYCWILANVDVFINLATGATFKEISKGVFKRIPILVPATKATQEFEEIVRPMAETVLNLQRQNRHLREARDMLLPRLMNGDITV